MNYILRRGITVSRFVSQRGYHSIRQKVAWNISSILYNQRCFSDDKKLDSDRIASPDIIIKKTLPEKEWNWVPPRHISPDRTDDEIIPVIMK